MLKSDAAAYLAGVTQVEGAQASAPTNLHVITGEVGQNSEDGKTTVSVDGLVFSEEDSQEIEMDTLGGLEEGDIATIILTGEAGHGMTPLAIGAVGSVDRINAKVIETQLLLADKADIQDLTAATARIGDLEADNVTINGRLQAAELDIDGIQADYLKAADLQAEQARVGNLLANKADVSDLTAATGRIDDLEADHVSVDDFEAATGRIDDLEADHVTVNDFTAATGRISDLEADHIGAADIEAEQARVSTLLAGKASVSDLNAAKGRISDLEADHVSVDDFEAATGRIGDLEADHIGAADIEAEQARVNNLLANKASVSDLNAAKGRISDLEADHVSVADFQAEQANIDTLQTNTADIATIRANSAKVQNLTAAQLEADHATVGSLSTTYATIANLNAANGRIDTLESTKANISDLEANYITADEIEATYMHANMSNSDVAWIENGTIKNGAIVSAMINDVSANKLTAGTINGSVINVTNLNADNITTGTINGQRIGTGSLSLDKLADDVYTETEVNNIVDGLNDRIDGAIETHTGTAVPTLNNSPASSWNTTALRDEHVGDVYYVVNSQSQQNGYCYRFTKSGSTYSWQLIKDSDVTAALSRLTTAEGKITTFDSDISTLKTDTGTLTTKTESLETSLGDKVDVTTFNDVSDTVDQHSQTISQMSETISSKADGSTVTSLTNRVSKNEQDITGVTTTLGELQNTLETKADGSTVETVSNKLNTVSNTVDGHTQTLTNVQNTLETKADGSTVSTLTAKVNTVSDTVEGHTTQLSSITSTQTTMQTTIDKTVKSSIQLWYSKANTTAPNKPTSQVTSTSTSGNAWRIVVPAYNSSYPHYFYCWQYEYVDGTYGWSAVVRDIAMGESQSTARTADSNASAAATTANANIKSSVQLWFTKADSTAPNKPTSVVSTSNANTANAWNLVVPVWNSSYPHYYYCYQQQKGDGTYQWTDVVYDRATSEAQQLANTTSTNLSTLQTNYATFKQTTEQFESTVGSRLTTIESDIDGVEERVSDNETSISNNASAIALKANSSDVYTKTAVDGKITQEVTDRNAAITAKANEITSTVSQNYTTKTEFADLEVGGRNLIRNTGTYDGWIGTDASDVEIVEEDSGTYVRFSPTEVSWSNVYGMPHRSIELLNGKTVTISCEVRGHQIATADGAAYLNIQAYENSTQCGRIGTIDIYFHSNDLVEGEWVKLTRTLTFHDDARTDFHQITSGHTYEDIAYFDSAIYDHGGFPIDFRHLKVEVGNRATDWTPAPEDIETRVSSAESAITQNATNINAKVSKNDVINQINLSTEGVLIDADRIEIDGTAVFNAIKSSADAAYDAKGAAATVQSNLDNLDIGGRNLLTGTDVWMTTFNSYSTCGKGSETIPSGSVVTVSVEVNADNLVWDTTSNTHRIGFETSLTKTGGGTQYFGVWAGNSISEPLNVVEVFTGSIHKRISKTFTLLGDFELGRSGHIYTQGVAQGTVRVGRAKIEYGSKASDWSPAPEDSLAEEQYIYISTASGTTSINKNTTWVTQSSDVQNVWTTKRPTYNSSYPVLFVAKQSKTVGGSVSCTTPVKDDTTTVIDGGHITTGTIDTNRLNADTIKSNIVQTTNLSASKITSGTLSTDRLDAATIKSNIVQTTDLSASKITSGDISADRIKANVIGAINSLTAGQINAERINATNLHVNAANIDGTLSIGKLSAEAQSKILNSKNLALLSDTPNLWTKYRPTAYDVAIVGLSENLVKGDKYTLTIWGTQPTRSDKTSTYYGIFWGGGNVGLGNVTIGSDGKGSLTFTAPNNSHATTSNAWIEIYNTPGVGASGTTYGANITRIKLEVGDIATDWTVAPEDLATKDEVVSIVDVGGRNLALDSKLITHNATAAAPYVGIWTTAPKVTRSDGFVAIAPKQGGDWAGPAVYMDSLGLAVGDLVAFSCLYEYQGCNANLHFYAMSTNSSGSRVYVNFPLRGSNGYGGTYHSVTQLTNASATNPSGKIWVVAEWSQAAQDLLDSGGHVRFTFQVNATTEVTSGGSVHLYATKLERGNKATDWTPAPEDVDADISEAAQTASNYIVADSSGIKIADANPSSATTYLHLASSFLDFIRGGASMLKAWLDGSVAKVRVGAESGFNTLTDNEGIKLRRGTTVLSQFATNLIELGKNSYNATISLLNNGIEIYATDIDPDHRVHFGKITSGDSYLQFAPWSTVEGDESAYSASAKFGVKHEFTSTRGFGVDDSVNIGGDGFVGLTTALVDSDDVPLAEAGMYAVTNMGAGNSEIAIIGDKVFLYDGGGNTSTYYGPFPMSDVASAIPVTLYDNANASASAAATLSESAANFKRLTIFFKDTDGNYSSTEVWSPNGKRVALSLTWINGASTQQMYQRVRWVTISGTTISTYKGSSDSKYRTGQVRLGGSYSVTNSDYISIVHVIGYR